VKISPIVKAQWIKVAKSLAYSFVSTFAVALMASNELSTATISAAAVSGVNAVLVTIKQLFTQA
jgi:hypothetical protein